MTPRSVASSALLRTRFFGGEERADTVLKKTLRAHPELDNTGRLALAELILGVTVFAHAIEAERPGLSREPAAFIDVLESGFSPKTPSVSPAFYDDVARSLGPKSADDFFRSTLAKGPITLRANALKITREALQERLLVEGLKTTLNPAAPMALDAVNRVFIRGLQSYQDGLFEVQDVGSQRVAHFCEAQPGERLLDLCAGNGGKTLALLGDVFRPMPAQRELSGEIVMHDIVSAKLENAKRRVLRAAGSIQIQVRSALSIDDEGAFDCVLVDAPCSQSGTLRRSPDLRHAVLGESEGSPTAYNDVQDALLEKAANHVGAKGRLVYATCSVFAEENEERVQCFLKRRKDFAKDEDLLLLPHTHGSDGFYMARLRRRAP